MPAPSLSVFNLVASVARDEGTELAPCTPVAPHEPTAARAPARQSQRAAEAEQQHGSARTECGVGACRRVEPAASHRARTAMVASVVGNILEWFDFGIFAFLSPQIGVLFFPAGDRFVSTLNAYVVFGGGFIFRPLGGVLLAHIGDVYGRKAALLVSVSGMAGATAAMGCLPTYEDIGPLAPVLLCVLRLIQGLSVGGELVGSIVFAVESMPPERQVLGGAICMAGAIAGLTLGAASGLILHALFTSDEILRFGWRIPFWSGLLIGIFAVWLRRDVSEPPPASVSSCAANALSETAAVSDSARDDMSANPLARLGRGVPGDGQGEPPDPSAAAPKLPVLKALQRMPLDIALCAAVAAMWCTACWLTVAFPPTLYQTLMTPPLSARIGSAAVGQGARLGVDDESLGGLEGPVYRAGEEAVWAAHVMCCGLQGVAILVWGVLGDLIGGSRLLMAGALGTAVVAGPCFHIMSSATMLAPAAAAQAVVMVVAGACGACLPAWMVLSFPRDVRFSAIALGYNAAQALFGGTAGIVGTLLFRSTGGALAVGLYVAALAFVSLTAVRFHALRQRARHDPPRSAVPRLAERH